MIEKIQILITATIDGNERYVLREVTVEELRNIGQAGFKDIAAAAAHNFYRNIQNAIEHGPQTD